MASEVMLRHPQSGLTRKGYIGYSWTVLLWGPWPPLFRGDLKGFLIVFLVMVVIGCLTAGIGAFAFSIGFGFFYNRLYTRRLIERGYVLADHAYLNAEARQYLGMTTPTTAIS